MLADDMKRIVEDITTSYEETVNFVNNLTSDTSEMIGKFRKDHSEMSKSLRNKLQMDFKNLKTTVGEFISDTHHKNEQLRKETLQILSNHEDIRLSEARALKENLRQFVNQVAGDIENLLINFAKVRKQMASNQKKSLTDFTNQLVKETTDMLKNFSEAHFQMASALKEMLSSDNFSRKVEVAEFMKELAKSHQAMANDLNNFLTGSENDRRSQFTEMMNSITTELKDIKDNVNNILNAFKEDRLGMSETWKEMTKKLHSYRSVGVKKVKELEEGKRKRIEKERAEAERKRLEQEEAEIKQRESDELKARILDTVTEEGMKLTEIGKVVGKAWQGLISIMNELIEDDMITKDDEGLYRLAK